MRRGILGVVLALALSFPLAAIAGTNAQPAPDSAIGELLTQVMPDVGLSHLLPQEQLETEPFNPFGGSETGIEFPEGRITDFGMAWVDTSGALDPTGLFDASSGLACSPPGTPPQPGAPGVYCGAADSAPGPFAGGFDVFAVGFGGNIFNSAPGSQIEIALITNNPEIPGVWDPFVPNDSFQAANFATVLRIADGVPQTPVDLVLNDAGTAFEEQPSDGRVVIDVDNNAMAFFEPGMVHAEGFRVYSFRTLLDSAFQENSVVAYSYPFVTDPLLPVDARQMVSLPPPVVVTDGCIGNEHFPEDPVDGDPSKVIAAGAFPPEMAGYTLEMTLGGPGGPDRASGIIDEMGLGQVEWGINVFGEYPILSGSVVNAQVHPVDPVDFGGGTLVVSDPEVPCDGSLLTAQPPTETTTTSTSTTTTTTTTTVAETTTTVVTDTTVAIFDDETGTSYTIWWWIGGLLLVVGGGLFFFAVPGDPCIPLKARWMKAQKACDEARKRLEERKKKLREAEKGLRDAQAEYDAQDSKADDLRQELERLNNSRRSSVTYGGVTYHKIPEGLVTAEGLESIIDSVQDQVDSHVSNMKSWQESVDRWNDIVKDHQQAVADAQAEVDRLCGEADAARKAYEDCIKQKTGPEPEPTPEPTGGEGPEEGTQPGGGEGVEPGGTPPGTTPHPEEPEPEPEPECEDGATREEELARSPFTVPKLTQSMTLTVEPPTEDFADWLAEKMGKAGGRLSPSNLNTPGFAGEVRQQLRGLDSGLGVSHSVTVSFPRQEITYACIQHWVCRNGTWQKSHTEVREISRRDLPDQTFSETGKMDSMTVQRLIGRAQTAYQQLARNWDRVEELCP